MTLARTLRKLNRLIQRTYSSDPTDPGLVISLLKNNQVYASIIRFGKPFGKSRTVEYKARRATTIGALNDLIRQIKSEPTVKVIPQKRAK
jgi:hypothetical protein